MNSVVATATVLWDSSEVPAATPYVNGIPVPANHNLPASFYLSSKPIWWGTIRWLGVGPDDTGGTDLTGSGTHPSAPAPQTNLGFVVQ